MPRRGQVSLPAAQYRRRREDRAATRAVRRPGHHLSVCGSGHGCRQTPSARDGAEVGGSPSVRARLRRLAGLDERWSGRLRVEAGTPAGILATVGAHLGDGPLWLLLWLAGIFYFPPPRRWHILAWLAISIAAGVITYAIKFTLKRPRPSEVDGFYSKSYDRHAFPSGHATRMGTLPLMGGWLFPEFAWLFWLISIWCILSRVALGVHYLGDVVVGWLIGAGVSLLALVLVLS
ncbi:MAG: phosphatase PAP2 family protein [Caldilineae bacterium]|nr:MAG: phosphatase PAP2 family protein [Caldilineae bacterium]